MAVSAGSIDYYLDTSSTIQTLVVAKVSENPVAKFFINNGIRTEKEILFSLNHPHLCSPYDPVRTAVYASILIDQVRADIIDLETHRTYLQQLLIELSAKEVDERLNEYNSKLQIKPHEIEKIASENNDFEKMLQTLLQKQKELSQKLSQIEQEFIHGFINTAKATVDAILGTSVDDASKTHVKSAVTRIVTDRLTGTSERREKIRKLLEKDSQQISQEQKIRIEHSNFLQTEFSIIVTTLKAVHGDTKDVEPSAKDILEAIRKGKNTPLSKSISLNTLIQKFHQDTHSCLTEMQSGVKTSTLAARKELPHLRQTTIERAEEMRDEALVAIKIRDASRLQAPPEAEAPKFKEG